MDPETKAAFDSLAQLVTDTSQSLQTEMHAELEALRADMDRGFERVEAATRRNSSSIVGGAAAIAALHRWAVQRDKLDSKRDREIRDLRARLQKIERSLKRRAS